MQQAIMTSSDFQRSHGSGPGVERDLIHRARSGDTKSFGELIERHQSTVFGIALAITSDLDVANDVSQDTFVNAWRGIAKLQEPERVGPWFNGIARNLANNAIRKQAREHQIRLLAKPAGELDVLDVEQREDARRILGVLSELPEKFRVPLVLYYQEERSVADVAHLLKLSPSAVKKRLERGRSLIKERVHGDLRTTLSGARVRAGLGATVLALLGDQGSAIAASSAGHAATKAVAGRTSTAKYWLAGLAAFLLVGLSVFYSFGREPQGESKPKTNASVRAAGLNTSPVSTNPQQGALSRQDSPVEPQQAEFGTLLDPAFPTVQLRVVDVLGGPIAGARVDDAVRDLIVGQTDANGILRVPITASLAGVFHLVEVRSPGYAKKDISLSGYGDYEVRMVPESTLSGRVLTPEKTPLAGIRVTAFARAAPGISESNYSAVTGPDGQFHLSGLAPGSHELRANGEGWTLAAQEKVELGMHESERAELIMAAGVSVSGLLDTHGSPIPEGLVVEARNEERPLATASVGPDGRFRFGALLDDEYEFVVRQISIAGRREVLVEGKAIEGIVMDVGRLHSQRFVAREMDGTPIVGVDISARQYMNDQIQIHRCATDAEGECTLVNLPEAPLKKVRPSAFPRDAAQEVTIPSEGPVEFVLPTSGGISGRAFGQNGEPLAYKIVTLTEPDARMAYRRIVTDSQGRYNFARLAEGKYVLRVFPTSDFIDPMVGSVESCGKETLEVLGGVQRTLDLRTELSLASVEGQVLDRDGSIVPGALVTFAVDHERHTAFDSRYSQVAVADTAGRFQLKNVPVGPSFRVLAQGHEGLEGMAIGVSAGDSVTVSLQTVTE